MITVYILNDYISTIEGYSMPNPVYILNDYSYI